MLNVSIKYGWYFRACQGALWQMSRYARLQNRKYLICWWCISSCNVASSSFLWAHCAVYTVPTFFFLFWEGFVGEMQDGADYPFFHLVTSQCFIMAQIFLLWSNPHSDLQSLSMGRLQVVLCIDCTCFLCIHNCTRLTAFIDPDRPPYLQVKGSFLERLQRRTHFPKLIFLLFIMYEASGGATRRTPSVFW